MRIHLRDGLPTESKALAPMVGQCEASSVGGIETQEPARGGRCSPASDSGADTVTMLSFRQGGAEAQLSIRRLGRRAGEKP